MIGLDTTVVARYLLGDDNRQSRASQALIDQTCSPEMPGFISMIVLVELWWLMVRSLKIPISRVAHTISLLLQNPNLRFHDPESVLSALSICMETNADFADCLIAFENMRNGASKTLTFDQAAIKALIMSPVPD